MNIRQKVAQYTRNPVIADMWAAVRSVPAMRSISVDITHRCNLRCTGCYFFAEDMDQFREGNDQALDEFILKQKDRGITFATVIGGEPALVPERLRKLASHFNLMIVTNGSRPIPKEGLENVAIAISVWGDEENDIILRGNGKREIFRTALRHYQNDERAIWYITLPSSPSPETEDVVDACVANGNLVSFNFYGDLESIGGSNDHRGGFASAREFVLKMLNKYPLHVAFNKYLNFIITTGLLKGQRWGYDVCGSVSVDNEVNAARLKNGNSYNPFFNAYLPDLKSTRRCCVGEDRDCSTCFDVWSHVSWIAMNMENHLDNIDDFFGWLSTMYIFYGSCRLIPRCDFVKLLPIINSWTEQSDNIEI